MLGLPTGWPNNDLAILNGSPVEVENERQAVSRTHLLVLSVTYNGMSGPDRDWANLANSLPTNLARVTWVGRKGTASLRPYLNSDVVQRLVDVPFPDFAYLVNTNAQLRRSRWLWTKIILDHLVRLRKPLLQLRKAMADDPPDVVVSNTTAVTIGAAYALLCRKPHVWCIKECLDYRQRSCRRLAALIQYLSSAVVVPSAAVAQSFRTPVHIFPDGSDLSVVGGRSNEPDRAAILERLGLPPDRLVVAQVGGVHPWKGQHVTASAVARLAASQEIPPFSVIFLGDGDETYKGRVRSIVAEAGPDWANSLRFVRFEPHDFSYLRCADIVVHPSVLPDPYPNAVREAMLVGKPVIGSNAGGISEMIRHEQTGLLVVPDDADDLAAKLGGLLRSPAERERLGRAAQAFGRLNFDVLSCREPFLDLFRMLAKKNTG